MRIGDYNKRLELQKKTQISDGIGGFTITHVTEATVWGYIWPIGAKERIQANQINPELTHRIGIRYRSVMRPDWRIKYGNRYFSIDGPPINKNETNRWLEFLCKEIKI